MIERLPDVLTTFEDLERWVIAAMSTVENLSEARRYVLREMSGQRPDGVWVLAAADDRHRRQGSLPPSRAGGALLATLQRRWPTSGTTGARAYLTPFGLLRRLQGEAAVRAAERGWAEVRRLAHEADDRRERLERAVEYTFGCDGAAACDWLWAERPELGGQSPYRAVETSPEALDILLTELHAIATDRDERESASWRLKVDTDVVQSLVHEYWVIGELCDRSAYCCALSARLFEGDVHLGVVMLEPLASRHEARPASQRRTSSIAWFASDAGAEMQRLERAALAWYGRYATAEWALEGEPIEHFLWELVRRHVRRLRAELPESG